MPYDKHLRFQAMGIFGRVCFGYGYVDERMERKKKQCRIYNQHRGGRGRVVFETQLHRHRLANGGEERNKPKISHCLPPLPIRREAVFFPMFDSQKRHLLRTKSRKIVSGRRVFVFCVPALPRIDVRFAHLRIRVYDPRFGRKREKNRTVFLSRKTDTEIPRLPQKRTLARTVVFPYGTEI